MDKDEKEENVEVMPPEEEEPQKALVQQGTKRPSPITARGPAAFPFINKFNRKRVETFTEVIKAENNLMNAIGDHAKSKDKLRDIDIEIDIERLKRRNELTDQQRKALLAKDNFTLEKKEIELRLAEIDAKVAALKKPPEEPPKPKSKAEENAEKLREQEERHAYEVEKEILEKKKEVLKWRRVDEEKELEKQEVLKDILKKYEVDSLDELPPKGLKELARKYEDLEGVFEKMKADE